MTDQGVRVRGDANPTTAIELIGITKRFPGVIAVDDVTFSVQPTEIHALVGENGAGKSTLMKILYGMQSPDEGEIRINGAPVRFKSPKDAIAAGIGMVHQHFMLADNFTILENIILGSEPRKGPMIDVASARRRIEELGATYGLEVDPDQLVEYLEVGERQRVEILKVLYRGAHILILDEPTAVLVPHEVDELFRNLQELQAEGETIIFISHKLDEVLANADRITVLREGRTIKTVTPDEVDAGQLAELMVGSELPRPDTTESTVTDVVELGVDHLTVADADGRALVDDVSFQVHKGEVVGIAGVLGNGQAELVESLIGLRSPAAGRITLGEDDITHLSTRHRHERGIAYIPEDRQRQGLLLSAPLWENTMLGHQSAAPFDHLGWVDEDAARRRTTELIEEFDVRAPSTDVSAFALSGGNQQKLIVGREMVSHPRTLIAAHPTRGIDVGAQAAVWDQLREARRGGLAVLLVSADLEELIGLSDTVYVILRGKLVAKLDPATVTPKELGSYMTGARSATTAEALP
jgi:simple sugar transport system ATP-binding protein